MSAAIVIVICFRLILWALREPPSASPLQRVTNGYS